MLYRPRRHWTLASFVPRRSNQHARAAGIRFVAQERPAPTTLVLAGPPGSGKTHLLHALAQYARGNSAIDSISCLSAPQWAQEVASGEHFGDLCEVMQRFAWQDLLALDDADRLWGMPQAQQAFADLAGNGALDTHRRFTHPLHDDSHAASPSSVSGPAPEYLSSAR